MRDQLASSDSYYTLSMTIYLDGSQCWTKKYINARDECNLFLIEGLFMLYFHEKNYARFHFYAADDSQ